MPSTPLICYSIGVASDCSTVSEYDPTLVVFTCISGGTILGYWATGRPRNATIPAIVMMIEITIATIGRLMKNFAITPPAFLARRWLSFLFRLPGTSRIRFRLLVGLGRHSHARPNLLDSLANDLVPFLQSLRNNHLPVKARSDFDRPNLGFVILADNSDLITALQLD